MEFLERNGYVSEFRIEEDLNWCMLVVGVVPYLKKAVGKRYNKHERTGPLMTRFVGLRWYGMSQ